MQGGGAETIDHKKGGENIDVMGGKTSRGREKNHQSMKIHKKQRSTCPENKERVTGGISRSNQDERGRNSGHGPRISLISENWGPVA